MDKPAYGTVDGRYGKLTVFSNDTGAATQSLLLYGEWAENEISFLKTFAPPGGTVVDAGAYIGTHTLAFARFVGPSGRVIAIEAQPETFQLLSQNVASIAAGVVQLENAIVSNEAGELTIPTIDVAHPGSFGSASLQQTLTDSAGRTEKYAPPMQGKVSARALTIDSFDLQECALIKADVEGGEHLMLNGAQQTLRRCSPVVYCECNSLASGLKSLEALQVAGYKVFAHVVNAFNPDNFFRSAQNIFNDAREVALLGIPAARSDDMANLVARPCELLLAVDDADDLALALLNKPQYPFEVLRQGRAAQNGGAAFLGCYDALRLRVDHLENERRVVEEQLNAARAEMVALAEQKEAQIASVHALLRQRDTDIAGLQSELAEKYAETSELHAVLQKRDGELDRMKNALADVFSSKSWKLTALLRSVSERMRSFLNKPNQR